MMRKFKTTLKCDIAAVRGEYSNILSRTALLGTGVTGSFLTEPPPSFAGGRIGLSQPSELGLRLSTAFVGV